MPPTADFEESRHFPTFKEVVARRRAASSSSERQCLLAEIDGYIYPNFVRPEVHDRQGTRFQLSFMVPEMRNDPSLFRVGRTIAVINPGVQAFVDLDALTFRDTGDEIYVSEDLQFKVSHHLLPGDTTLPLADPSFEVNHSARLLVLTARLRLGLPNQPRELHLHQQRHPSA